MNNSGADYKLSINEPVLYTSNKAKPNIKHIEQA